MTKITNRIGARNPRPVSKIFFAVCQIGSPAPTHYILWVSRGRPTTCCGIPYGTYLVLLVSKIRSDFALDRFQAPVQWRNTNPVNSKQAKPNSSYPFSTENPTKTQPEHQVDASEIGFSNEKIKRIGFYPLVSNAGLCDEQALLELYEWYAAHGMVPAGPKGQLIIFEAAQNALEKGKTNKAGLFIHRVRNWNSGTLHPIGERIRDRAYTRLKRALGHDSYPRKQNPNEDPI